MRKFIDIACKLIIADHFIEIISIAVHIIRIGPISVFEYDGLPCRSIHIRIELFDGLQEIFARNGDTLLFVEQLSQIVNDEVVALFGVAAGKNVGLFESSMGQAFLRCFVQKCAIDNGHKWKFANAQRTPFLVDERL